MIEIETVKCEGCLRAIEGSRKPTCSQQLDMVGNDSICTTIAEVNSDLMYACK
jgi:hypothetical protein